MVAFISGLPQCRNAAVFASAQCRVAALEEHGKTHAPGAPGMPGGIRAAACIAFGPDAAIEEETVQGCGADELRWFYGECDRALAERLAVPAGLAQRGVKPVLAKAMDYMAEHYGAPLTLGDVARFAFASTCYISRLFMRELGMSFVDYLTALRMEKARRLLRGTRLKVFEVAELCGISDAHYFAKLFRRSTGFSPSEYRKDIKL
jgi:two-component system response regulator YesN